MHAGRRVSAERAVERALPWLAALVVAVPVLAGRYPPMIDLPCHEEIVAAMRHHGDPARYPPSLLTWNVGHPNQLFYFIAYACSFVLPVDAACKVVVAASVAAFPLAMGLLADHLRVSRWVAVVVAPFGLGFFFYFGFVGNLLSLGLLVASLPGLDRFASAPTARGAFAAALTLLLLYAAHDSAVLIGGLAIVVFSAGRRLGRAANAWRAVPLVLAACVVIAEQAVAMRHLGSNLRALPRLIDVATWQKFDQVPQALLGLHGATTTRPAFLVIACVLAVLAVRRVVGPGVPRLAPGVRGWVEAHRFELLGLLLVGLYFEVPFSFAGAMWLHARFLTPGVALLAAGLAPRPPHTMPLAVRVGSVVGVVAVLGLVKPEIAATGALYSDLDPLLNLIAPGSAIAALDMAGGPRRGLVFTVAGAAARAASERGGRMAVSFTQSSPIPPVIIARERRWEDSFLRMALDSSALEPSFDLRRFRYVLAWTPPEDEDDVTRALLPEARLVSRSGRWLLFESNDAVASLLSPEPTAGHGESVRTRMEALARAKREAARKP